MMVSSASSSIAIGSVGTVLDGHVRDTCLRTISIFSSSV